MENYDYDIIIIGSGPAGLGATFHLLEKNNNLKILIIEKSKICSGGLRNDGKQNYTYPIGFESKYWTQEEADKYLKITASHLLPKIQPRGDLIKYYERIKRIDKNIQLIEADQTHIGTDKASSYIRNLYDRLIKLGAKFLFNEEFIDLDEKKKIIYTNKNKNIQNYNYENLIIAIGRSGIGFLQEIMNKLNVEYQDNIIDIGVRIETKRENYPIVDDYYDPKIYFPDSVRTFCTNSGYAIVRKDPRCRYSFNGEALSSGSNGLVNFALLKTIKLTDPITSGKEFAEIIGKNALGLSNGKLIMQRVGDFRCKRRSTMQTFNDINLGHNFMPTCQANPGDIALGPLKIIEPIWRSLKLLDKIVFGILHPSTILYYPEIKMYANRPIFLNNYFEASQGIYLIGDGAGVSRGITAAWASGIRAADGILNKINLTRI